MKQILVVDDSAVIRKVTRRILEALHLDVQDAEDGAKALAVCAQRMPDAILLDWNLGGADGCDVLRQLRQMPEGGKPKVVCWLTEQDVAQIARASRAGADDHMLKPFDRAGLRAKLEEAGLV